MDNIEQYFKISDAAKLINIKGIGRNKLLEFLRDKKVLMSDNIPYQEFMNRELFHVVEKDITNSDGDFEFSQSVTLVTNEGIKFITSLVNNHLQGEGKIPIISRKEKKEALRKRHMRNVRKPIKQ